MNLEEVIVNALGKVKASNIIAFDTKEKSPFYDEMIIASVSSLRQATAVTTYLKEDVEEAGFKVRSIEGRETGWVIVDCYDILFLSLLKKKENISILKKYI